MLPNPTGNTCYAGYNSKRKINPTLDLESSIQVKNFKKTTTLFGLKNKFRQKRLSSSVIQYKAKEVEFIMSRNANVPH